MHRLDVHIYHLINGLAGRSNLLDHCMIFFAKYALELYLLLFIVAWFTFPKQDLRNRHALVIAGLSGILALIINVVIAHFWFRPRPFVTLPTGTYMLLVAHSPDASFPSDHVSGSFGFASASWGKNRKWVSYSFTILAVIVMFARVFVGVHYPSDVLAGLVVGVLASQVMWRVSRFIFPITRMGARLFKFGPQASSSVDTSSN